jgi:hypothetical protein
MMKVFASFLNLRRASLVFLPSTLPTWRSPPVELLPVDAAATALQEYSRPADQSDPSWRNTMKVNYPFPPKNFMLQEEKSKRQKYLHDHNIKGIMQRMVDVVTERKPVNVIEFLINHLEKDQAHAMYCYSWLPCTVSPHVHLNPVSHY